MPHSFRFSLRALLLVITALAGVIVVLDQDLLWPIYSFGSHVIFALLMELTLYLVIVAHRPVRRDALVGVVAAVFFALAVRFFDGASRQSVIGAVCFLINGLPTVEALAAFPLWFLAMNMCRVVRRTPLDFNITQVRHAATVTLVIGAVLSCYATAIIMANHRRSLSSGALYDRNVIAMWLTSAATVVGTVPWIHLLRRSATGVSPRSGFPDTLSKGLLALGITGIVLSLGIILRLTILQDPNPMLATILLMPLHIIVQSTIAVIFLIACAIQLYRNRWHTRLTVLAMVYLVPFWLLVAWEPQFLFVLEMR